MAIFGVAGLVVLALLALLLWPSGDPAKPGKTASEAHPRRDDRAEARAGALGARAGARCRSAR